MNQEVKQKWLNALRSGEYIQGKDYLKVDDKFCCLGVLTDLYIKEHDNCEWKDSPFINGEVQNNGFLCLKVRDWANLNSENPIIDSKEMRVSELNDTGYSFSEIADLIETHL